MLPTLTKTKETSHSRVSPGLVVMGGDLFLKVVSSNPDTVYWMYVFHVCLL